jgi:protein ImuB
LLDQLCARLSARALATQELQLQLELDHSCKSDDCSDEDSKNGFQQPGSALPRTFVRTLRLPVPLLDARTFLKLLQLDLRAHPPGAPIVKIYLRAEPSHPRAAQGGLFLPPTPEPEKLELTIAKIAAIVGEDKIGSLQLLDTYRAERFRMQRFAVPDSQKTKSNSPQKQSGETPGSNPQKLVTALRIFRPPLQTSVTLRDGKPVHVLTRKEIKGEVLWAAGPWRSSGDWWEQDGWARDEWDIAVQQENGITLYRLVRDLLRAQWFLEGSYD